MAARQYWQLLYGMLLNKKSNMPSAGRPLKAIFAYFLGLSKKYVACRGETRRC